MNKISGNGNLFLAKIVLFNFVYILIYKLYKGLTICNKTTDILARIVINMVSMLAQVN